MISGSPPALGADEPFPSDSSPSTHFPWIQVLVDCPGIQGLYTYKIPNELTLELGDILIVSLGSQQVGGIAIQFLSDLPPTLSEKQIRPVEDVVTRGFFAPAYWQLLNQVADYYCTELMAVVRLALPPGLLGRSQRRIRLLRDTLPSNAEQSCSALAQPILRLLLAQKQGDYSANHLQKKVKGASKGIRELIQLGWARSYLELPTPPKPQTITSVILVGDPDSKTLTRRQREILHVLKTQGGDIRVKEFLPLSQTTLPTLKKLASLGYVLLEEREVLRLEQGVAPLPDTAKPLTAAQAQALETIQTLDGYQQVILHGVTGSGKTEIYLQAIAPLLAQGQSALVLVPEIGLTPQATDRFRARFGNRVCVYHSALSEGERYDTWRQMLQGEPQVVIGTRSAIFAPLPHLGLIILDEEHDSSYKQTQLLPAYHARTVAQWRSQGENCPLILGSATPSLETWLAQRDPQSHYLPLSERIESRPLPPVSIVDMRQELQQGNRSLLSRSLHQALAELRDRKQQAILFINRRGHSTFVSCRNCGCVINCPHCDVSLSYHYTHQGAAELLRCHYCNYTIPQPRFCPDCQSPYLKFFGSGTQKVTQTLSETFPDLRWLRFDSDTTRSKGAHRRLLTQFAEGQADVLVGTQMLTKGLDLAQVTLVGVVAADGLLFQSDYRSAERAFQTLTQVAGRAGRGAEPGQVIIQTYSPEHPVIQAVRTHDYQTFIAGELPQRADLGFPPYGRLILLRLSGEDETEVMQTADSLRDLCDQMMGERVEILGPAPASIARVARRFRWNLLLKFLPTSAAIQVDRVALRQACPTSVSLAIDVDPLSID